MFVPTPILLPYFIICDSDLYNFSLSLYILYNSLQQQKKSPFLAKKGEKYASVRFIVCYTFSSVRFVTLFKPFSRFFHLLSQRATGDDVPPAKAAVGVETIWGKSERHVVNNYLSGIYRL